MAMLFDEIGEWSEIKLNIVEKYALPYSRILSSRKDPEFHHIYIDAFAGSGKHRSKTTQQLVPGSPQRALDIIPPFKEYFFIDTDGDKIAELNRLDKKGADVHIIHGDCNHVLINEVFPNCQYRNFRRGLCLLDPYGLDLNWTVIEQAGQMKTIDMILNFPVMDINRNVLWSNPDGVDPADINRMNLFWGDDSWKDVAYQYVHTLFGEDWPVKQSNNTIAMAFRERLKDVAGFEHVPQPLPMVNSRGSTIYYLFFASQQKIANKLATDIINIYQIRRGIK